MLIYTVISLLFGISTVVTGKSLKIRRKLYYGSSVTERYSAAKDSERSVL